MKKLIELTGIQKSFPTGDGPLPVLKGIDLTVCHGEFVTIVGSSGSGKSTLMNIIGCLDTPDKGSYLLDGEDVSDLVRQAAFCNPQSENRFCVSRLPFNPMSNCT